MNELKKLTWKYFWQQKWKEIKPALLGISFLIFVALIGFGLGSAPHGEIYSMKMIIVGTIILGCWLVYGLIQLIKVICKWIKSNWQKATERAIKDLSAEELLGLEEI